MSFLFPKKPTPPQAPPPVPTVDDAMARMKARGNNAGRRGRAADVLTSEEGLPNLGSIGTRMLTGRA